MSNEISYNFVVSLKNGNLSDGFSSGASVASQTTAAMMKNVQTVTTTEGVLDQGSVTTPGWCYFQNLDSTNFVQIGSYVAGTFYPFLTLSAGQKQLVNVAVSSIYAKADTASVSLSYAIYAR